MRKSKASSGPAKKTPAQLARNRIARRVALEFQDGMYGILLLDIEQWLKMFKIII